MKRFTRYVIGMMLAVVLLGTMVVTFVGTNSAAYAHQNTPPQQPTVTAEGEGQQPSDAPPGEGQQPSDAPPGEGQQPSDAPPGEGQQRERPSGPSQDAGQQGGRPQGNGGSNRP